MNEGSNDDEDPIIRKPKSGVTERESLQGKFPIVVESSIGRDSNKNQDLRREFYYRKPFHQKKKKEKNIQNGQKNVQKRLVQISAERKLPLGLISPRRFRRRCSMGIPLVGNSCKVMRENNRRILDEERKKKKREEKER